MTQRAVVAVDVGSNTISCCRMEGSTSPVIVSDVSLPVRLSEGLHPGGRLRAAAVERSLEALERIRREMVDTGCTVDAVGTAVLRAAADPQSFCAPAARILGVPVRIISGEEEARLTASGAVFALPQVAAEPVTVLDVGGRSTELALVRNGAVVHVVSLDLGVVSATEQWLPEFPAQSHIAALRDHVLSVARPEVLDPFVGTRVVCTGGTPTTAAVLERGLARWDPDAVHGTALAVERLEHWFDAVARIPVAQRISELGMKPLRADVFPAGAFIIVQVVRRLGAADLVVSAYGLRVGLAHALWQAIATR